MAPTEKNAALAEDIRLLGRILGETIRLHEGDDTYVFGRGYGQDRVGENANAGTDAIRLAAGVTPQEGHRVRPPKDDVEAPPTSPPGHVRRHGAENRDAGEGGRARPQLGGQAASLTLRTIPLGKRHGELHEAPVGRKPEGLA